MHPRLLLVKLERVGKSGPFVRGPISATVGELLDYEMVLTNTGDVALTVDLSDPRCDSGTLSPRGPRRIAPGSTATYTCSHRLVKRNAGKFVNVATAFGRSTSGLAVGPLRSRVVARVSASGVLGAHKVIRRKAVKKHKVVKKHRVVKKHKVVKKHVTKHVKKHVEKHKAVKRVVKVAKPAKPVVKSASFTG